MLLKRTDRGWIMYDDKIRRGYFLNSTQIADIMAKLETTKFKRVYFHKKSISDLVIELHSDIVIIKDYSVIKDRPYIKNIKDKINFHLLKFAMHKVIKKHSGKLLLATVSSIALLGTVHLIQNKDLTPIDQTPQIGIGDMESIPDDSLITTKTTTNTSTITETTTIPTTTTTTTVPTILDDEERANEYFDHYCNIFEIYDEEKEKLYYQNIRKLENSDNIEQAVIDLLYGYYSENLYMQRPIYYNGYSEEEQEATILKYAKIKGIEDEEILATMLAVHQLETGHGTSDVCYYKNNLGGNKVVNPYTGELEEHQTYPNVEVGAIDFVNDFVRIMNNTYDPNLPIEEYMNPVYCETDSWYKTVRELKDNIKSSNHLEKIEEVLTKMKKEEKGKSY